MARELKNTKDVRLRLNTGTTPDGFSEVVQVEDTNNAVFLPDGSAMQPREGSEIRRRDEIGFGSDRKVIYFIADPPDIDYGDMICLVNTKDGRNDVQASEVVRTTVTRSDQNPLPMPDLPDWTPPPTLNPLLASIDSSGEFYEASVVFYDTDTQTVVGPATLSAGLYFTWYAYVFRTENFLCIVDRHSVNTLNLNAWLLNTIKTNPEGSYTPDYYVQVYTDVADVTPFKPMWAYKGDIVFVADDVSSAAHTGSGPDDDTYGAHDYKLYKISLTDETVTSVSITNLPSDVYGFMNREYDCDGVDSDGYLWTSMYGENGYTLIKIDPSTGAVVASGLATGDVGNEGYNANVGMAAGPNGVMYYDNTLNATYGTSADAQTQTLYSSSDSFYLYAPQSTVRNSLIGTKTVAFSDSGDGGVGLVDITVGTMIGTLVDPYSAHLPASILSDGSEFWFAAWDDSSDETQWTMYKVDPATGSRSTFTFSKDIGTSTPFVFADAFAYGLKNIQGNRLT